MKFVWHWKNIAKTTTLVVVCAAGWTLAARALGIAGSDASVLIGALIGFSCAQIGLIRWPAWHFEYDT